MKLNSQRGVDRLSWDSRRVQRFMVPPKGSGRVDVAASLVSEVNGFGSLVSWDGSVATPNDRITKSSLCLILSVALATFSIGWGSAACAFTATFPEMRRDMAWEICSQGDTAACTVVDHMTSQIAMLGAMGSYVWCISSLLVMPLIEKIGRKSGLICMSLFMLVGSLMMAFGRNYRMVLAGRIVQYTGCAILSLGPTFLAECAPTHLRVRFTSMGQLGCFTGQFVAAAFAWPLLRMPYGWRIGNAIPAVTAALSIILCAWVSESPRWLRMQGQHVLSDQAADNYDLVIGRVVEESQSSAYLETTPSLAAQSTASLTGLRKLSGARSATSVVGKSSESLSFSSNIEDELRNGAYSRDLSRDVDEKIPMWNVLRELLSNKYRGRFLIALSLPLMGQLTGIAWLLQFAPTMYRSVVGVDWGLWLYAGTLLVRFMALAVAGLCSLDKRISNRSLLASAAAVSCVFRLAQACSVLPRFLNEGGGEVDAFESKAAATIYVLGSAFFAASYSIAWGNMPWVVMTEYLPTRLRGVGMAISSVVQGLTAGSVQKFAPVVIEKVGLNGLYFGFSVMCACAAILARTLLINTKGMSMEEVDQMLKKKPNKRILFAHS